MFKGDLVTTMKSWPLAVATRTPSVSHDGCRGGEGAGSAVRVRQPGACGVSWADDGEALVVLGGFLDAGEVWLGGSQNCGWAVRVEVDGVDACLPSVQEADRDWLPEDDLDVVRALECD